MEFENPSAWFGLLAVPLAVLLAIWRRRPLEVAVPSILHWKAATEMGDSGARRLRREGLASILRIAAAVALLVAAIAGPVAILSEGRGRALIVIDRSASMQTRHGGRTRLDRAKDLATRLLESWGDSVQVRVGALPAGPPKGLDSTAVAARAIADVTPSILPLDPEGLLPAILPPPEREESVFLFTDQVPSWAARGDVAVASVGGPSDNVGITEFDAGPDGIFVSVGNFSSRPRDVRLRLAGRDPGGAVTRETSLSLPPGEERIWTASLPRLEEVTVRILGSDSFPLDDEVRATAPAYGPFRCTLIGGPCPSIRRALEAIPGLEIVAPSDGKSEPVSLGVYYRRLPPPGAEGPLVLIDPPESWGAFRLGSVIESPRSILSTGPAWEGLSLSGVRLRQARELHGPGLDPILRCLPTGETIAGAFQGKGWRAIVIAFDTETGSTNWQERVSYPIFWARVAEWAGLRSPGPVILRGGEPILGRVDFPPGHLLGPDGSQRFSSTSARPVSWLPESPGLYILADRAGEHPFSVNLLSLEESANGGEPLEIPEEMTRVPLREPARMRGRPLLVLLFAAIAAYEWFRRQERIA